ncbi:MAG: leucyl/phenylalanyl-tRNA--protein transferase [Gammaproteobacteria bacterium]|nr:leucyl/phenylalanyl-tRNA--protein transferase [Gammaproteobacteria bacterium]
MIYVLDSRLSDAPFPPVERAESEPNGLLAIGGDLSLNRLLNAYRAGIFPWYSVDQPILWWSPDPRLVLFPKRIRVSRSLKKAMKRQPFEVSFDNSFSRVISACSEPRLGQEGTWITTEMKSAYTELHRQGFGHSVEVWLEGRLVGGLYGVAIGQVFYGESMFSRVPNASKVALVHLARFLSDAEFRLIDCQVHTDHLVSMGAEPLDRESFCWEVAQGVRQPGIPGSWQGKTARAP